MKLYVEIITKPIAPSVSELPSKLQDLWLAKCDKKYFKELQTSDAEYCWEQKAPHLAEWCTITGYALAYETGGELKSKVVISDNDNEKELLLGLFKAIEAPKISKLCFAGLKSAKLLLQRRCIFNHITKPEWLTARPFESTRPQACVLSKYASYDYYVSLSELTILLCLPISISKSVSDFEYSNGISPEDCQEIALNRIEAIWLFDSIL